MNIILWYEVCVCVYVGNTHLAHITVAPVAMCALCASVEFGNSHCYFQRGIYYDVVSI